MMRPPPLYPPPPAPIDSLPAGYSVTLSGAPARVLQQQRLLPLSRNILCLPALSFTGPPAPFKRQSSLRDIDEPPNPHLIRDLKLAILKLHREYVARQEAAKEWLSTPRTLLDSERRVVFFNGGERDAKELCIVGLRTALGDEDAVGLLWEEIVRGGVEGLERVETGRVSIDVVIPAGGLSPIEGLRRNDSLLLQRAREREVEKKKREERRRNDSEERRHQCMDSTYSSGVDEIPTPPASAEIRDPEFLYQSNIEGREEQEHVTPLFTTADDPKLEIHLVPEKFDTRQQLLDRLLPPTHYGIRTVTTPVIEDGFRRTRAQLKSSFKIDCPADKLHIQIQNEIRALLTKYLPPANTAETPTQAEYPEAANWLLDPEHDLFAPMFSTGNEGLPEALCPSLDLVVAVGADGREAHPTVSDDLDRAAASLASTLGRELEMLGNRDINDTRGVRITMRYVLRQVLPYLRSHPGATIDDVAAGHYLLAAMEASLKTNPGIRLIILEFDLRTGSQAVCYLQQLLPKAMMRSIIIGEQSPAVHTHRGIYVRQSIGKTTMSFSSLPSPIAHTRPKPRRFEAARTKALATADLITRPSTKQESAEYAAAVALTREAIRERRVECGVIIINAMSSPSMPAHKPSSPPKPPTPPEQKPTKPPTPPAEPPVQPLAPAPILRQPPPPRDRSMSPTKGYRRPSSNIDPLSPPRARSSSRQGAYRDSIRSSLRSSVSSSLTTHHRHPPPCAPLPEPPHPGQMLLGRRDSDPNVHGGGVRISSPPVGWEWRVGDTDTDNENSTPRGSNGGDGWGATGGGIGLGMEGVGMGGGILGGAGTYWEESDDEGEREERERERRRREERERKGSKALRWLGIIEGQ